MADEAPQPNPPQQPTEEEIRAAMEEEVKNLRVQDLILQTVASVLNLSARRIGKQDERDLDQAKVGIDAVAALVPYLEEEPAKQVESALSELRMAYAKVAGGEELVQPGADAGAETPSEPPVGGPPEDDQGGGQRPSGLWTPGP